MNAEKGLFIAGWFLIGCTLSVFIGWWCIPLCLGTQILVEVYR